MYRNDPKQTEFIDFHMPFGGKLSPENRWIKLAAIVPWSEVEECYRNSLDGSKMGAPAKSGRIAFGALIIKERLGITDEETVAQIQENPYLQYFLGLHQYRESALFDPSMMVHFRSRFGQKDFECINTEIIAAATGETEQAEEPPPGKPEPRNQQETPQQEDHDTKEAHTPRSEESTEPSENDTPPANPKNRGKLLMDASCTPADITYPTDLKLLNEAREKTECYIDKLHAPHIGQRKKPRTYRRKARKQLLAVTKKKKASKKLIRKAIGQQLRYLRRNLGHLDRLLETDRAIDLLSGYNQKCLEVIRKLYEQQLFMYENRVHRVAERIVSISQPHVRPIVRGKAGTPVEFGAKISVSHIDGGYVFLDHLSWDAFNESGDFIDQVEKYRQRFGCYPASVHADTIYRTRANRQYCKEKGIRLSGPALGRPKKQTSENAGELKAQRKLQRQDELDRIPIEGKFGNAKRKGTLSRIMAKLSHTAESVIHIGIIVLNLDTRLRRECLWLWREYLLLLERLQKAFEMRARHSNINPLRTILPGNRSPASRPIFSQN